MTKSFFAFLFILTFRSIGLGQSMNFLVYQGDTLQIYGEPLETLFKKDSTNRPSSFFKKPFCDFTPCYVTFWDLTDNKIQLTAIRQCCKNETETVDLSQFFGDKVKDGRLIGDWLSEELFCPTGDPRKDTRGIPKYNSELGFNFIKGELKEIKQYDNSRTSFSELCLDDNKLHYFLNGLLDKKLFKKKDGLEFHGKVRTDETGKIVSVRVEQGFGEPYDSEIIKAIMQIGHWAVVYRHGQIVDGESWVMFYIMKKLLKKS